MLDDIVDITGTKKHAGRTKQATGRIAPAHTRAVAKTVLHLAFRLDHRRSKFKRAAQINRAIGHREDHRLFGRYRERIAGRVVRNIAVGRLGQAPFPNIAFVQAARALGQFSSACRSFGQSIEQPEPKSNARGRHAHCAAKIAEHFADEFVKFCFVEHLFHRHISHDWRPVTRTIAFP